MTDKLIQEELDLVLEIDEYIEDHNPHHLEYILEVDNVIAEFKTHLERFRKYQTELKFALGEDYGEKYPGRNETRKTFRKYLGVLETKGKELRREKETREANLAAEKEAREAKECAEIRQLELKRLADAADARAREADERTREANERANEREKREQQEALDRAHAIKLEELRLAQKDKCEALDRAEVRARGGASRRSSRP